MASAQIDSRDQQCAPPAEIRVAEETLDLSVVIPVYKSRGSLPQLLPRLERALRERGASFEVVLVNDHAPDDCWSLVEQWAASQPWVRGICLTRNYGQHNALLCGVRAARGARIVTLDDDLQHPPEEIGKLLTKLDEGFDVVYGVPQRERHGVWRTWASRVTKLALQEAMGAGTARQVSAFRAFHTSLREAFADYSGPFVCLDVLLTWGAERFAAVATRHDERALGQSHYTFRKLAVHAVNMVTGFSALPLRLASWAGFACTLFGLAVLVYVLARYVIEGASVPGFAFLACIIAIFSGVQLFALGIIGEYLARMHFRLMARPSYVVRQSTGTDAHASR